MRIAFVALLCVALAACGRPQGVMEPIGVSVPNASLVDLLVATTRAPAKNPAILFTGERESKVALADITVSIPPADRRQIGQVQWPSSLPPNPLTDFATVRVTPLAGVGEARGWLKQNLPRDRRVLVFVHGFNVRFEEAVFSLAQIVHDSGAEAAPVLFTWPSRGNLFQYIYDRESTNASRDALEETLRRIATDPSVGEVTVMAHSMGSWLVMESLRQMSIRDGRVLPKIRNVILASPDLDIDVFAAQWAEISKPRPRLTVFSSRDDAALRASRRLAGDVDRLGLIDPLAEPFRSELERAGVDVIDLTDLSRPGSLNHSKFAENPEIVQLLGKRLIAGQSLGGETSLGERVGGFAMGVGQTVGGVAGVAVSAPLAIVDPNSRRTFDDQLKHLGDVANDTVDSARPN
ncbi:protein of unknown function DUF900 hydrolase family protein [Methylocella silvestris BL2]|uniref:Esterase n=1 Tax=Methylocella silvestris (strain DSM 15510 / CIP 108128 / LMG 27833 / NCIMB 13906 / BL2) TaxID=395965 RepID=B8ELL6_METSB|nr:alpha/beta hydrolase [Methylocella silvestris]ACK50010.1 protein of unknown function DUF900 hydrolase family protein [Methylocella silvestris BL2]